MKGKIKSLIIKCSKGPLGKVFSIVFQYVVLTQYFFLNMKWRFSGMKKPEQNEVEKVCDQVTFIYKSFERQKMAKRLYKNIQSYYPGVRVIIADDSRKPLELKGENLTVIQLPFNSGLSYGLNRALELVETPFVVRMDDDQLLTPYTKFGKQLEFLEQHSEVDLAAVVQVSAPKCHSSQELVKEFYGQSMSHAVKTLKIPHMTWVDESHVVVGKAPNVFVARTEKVKEVGYDDNIRMIDHNEFFYRAAGNLVSVVDPNAFVFHYHNRFDTYYQKYRMDVLGDRVYIRNKHR